MAKWVEKKKMANEEDSKFNGSECAPRKGFSVLKVICVLVIPHSYINIRICGFP